MANYGTMVLTTAGLALLTKAQAGTQLQFTKMSVGSGSLGNINPQSLTALIQPQFDVSISSITKDTVNMMAYISGSADNSAISTQLYICELGLFATDPDIGEILYGYANAGSAGDYIPPASVGLFTRKFTINAAVGNAPDVTVVIPSNRWASLDSNGLILPSELPSAASTTLGAVELSSTPPTGHPAVAVYEGDFTAHLADYVRQPGYGADTGTVNHLVVTLNPAPTSYVDGMGIAAKAANTNTGAVDINSNILGVKSVVNPDGSALLAGDITAGGIYSLKYNATTGNFILVGKGGDAAQLDAIIEQYTNGSSSTINAGTVCQFLSNGQVQPATGSSNAQCIALTSVLAGQSGQFILRGIASSLSGLTPAMDYYCSSTGTLVTTPNGNAVGVAISTTQLLLTKGFWGS